MIHIEIANRQKILPVDRREIRQLVHFVLSKEGVAEADISLAFLDDATLHELNRKHLGHDWPTDVLTFPLSEGEGPLVGEIVLSAEYAARRAPEFGHEPLQELRLYIIHGLLHLLGEDDTRPAAARRMHRRQNQLLRDWEQRKTRGSSGVGGRQQRRTRSIPQISPSRDTEN